MPRQLRCYRVRTRRWAIFSHPMHRKVAVEAGAGAAAVVQALAAAARAAGAGAGAIVAADLAAEAVTDAGVAAVAEADGGDLTVRAAVEIAHVWTLVKAGSTRVASSVAIFPVVIVAVAAAPATVRWRATGSGTVAAASDQTVGFCDVSQPQKSDQ